MTLQELREKRAELGTQLKQVIERYHAAGKKFTAEEEANYTRLNKDFDELTRQIKEAEAVENRDKQVAETAARIAELESTPAQRVTSDEVRAVQIRGQRATEMGIRTWAMLGRDRLRDEISQRELDNFQVYRKSIYAEGRRGVKVGDCDKNNLTVRLDGGYGLGREVSSRSMARSAAEFRARFAAEFAAGLSAEERAAMGVSIDTLGGFAVPEGFVYNLEKAMRAYGGIRERATVRRTETANPLPFPTIVDATPGSVDPAYGGALMNVGELLGENSPTDLRGLSPVMGALILGAQKFSSKMIPISHELLRDSAFNMPAELGGIIGERIGRIMARVFAFGSGRGVVPRGLGRDAPISLATAVLGAIGYDDIINFMHTLEPAYRMDGACWMLHDLMIRALRLIKDGFGRPIWQDNLSGGIPEGLLGFPVQRVQELPYDFSGDCLDGSVNNQLMLFGYTPLYQIREVSSMRLIRLVERQAELDQELFIGFMEADGGLLNAGTLPVKALANHGVNLGRPKFSPKLRGPGMPNRADDMLGGAMVDDNDEEIDTESDNVPARQVSERDRAAALEAIQNAGKKK
jgi:HK97 family phage major capsid protein